MKLLPLDLINHPPAETFTRLAVPEHEAIHTGGLYLSPDKTEVWKPLDAKPYANADCRIETREAEVLHSMAGQPGFPKNWRVESANGRRWLVRPLCQVVGQTFPLEQVDLAFALAVEQAVRSLNAHFWEINDNHLSVAIDPVSGEPFILDLSNASPIDPHSTFKPNDCYLIEKWFVEVGLNDLATLRCHARSVTHSAKWMLSDRYDSYQHVYRCNRSLPKQAAFALDGVFQKYRNQKWLVTRHELEPELMQHCDLTWGWSSIVYQLGRYYQATELGLRTCTGRSIPVICTGQLVVVDTCGVRITGVVEAIAAPPWAPTWATDLDICYKVNEQWYSQSVFPAPEVKLRSQWFLGKLYTDPSDPPILLVKHDGNEQGATAPALG
ncbi:MAG: hypothetical protein NW224_12755 [Leptolyngbyaceae cyanobacterium bins.302]|nr:hypothetical protein [Leptolyngbyaceae cyanobacterium bins.302]